MGEIKEGMQERNLSALVRNKGFQFTDVFFPYTSGQIGPYYVQSVVVENNGEDYKTAIKSMCHLAKDINAEPFEAISGGESRDWDFSNPVAYELAKPHAKIYKDGKIMGAEIKGKTVLHVADLNNEGSSPRDLWVPAIKKAGGTIKRIIFYVDRLEDGVGVMKELGLESHAVVPLDAHAWDYLLKQGVVTKEIYSSLMKRMENKDAWATDMLRSPKGLEKLAEMLNNPKEEKKAMNILDIGYPDLKNELADKLKAYEVDCI